MPNSRALTAHTASTRFAGRRTPRRPTNLRPRHPHISAHMGPSCCMCGWFGEGWRGCTLSASRFRAVQRLDSKGRKTGCRTAEFDNASASWRAPLSKASTSMTPAQSSCQYDLAPGHRVVAAVDHPAMAEVPVGDVGKFSKPAQLRFSSKPIPHGPSADTKIRLPPGSRSRSTDPNPSSPSHYSPSAATHHGSQAETDPHIQQESPICAVMGGYSSEF